MKASHGKGQIGREVFFPICLRYEMEIFDIQIIIQI